MSSKASDGPKAEKVKPVKVRRAPIPYTAGVVKQGTNKLGYTPRVSGAMGSTNASVSSFASEAASGDSHSVSSEVYVLPSSGRAVVCTYTFAKS